MTRRPDKNGVVRLSRRTHRAVSDSCPRGLAFPLNPASFHYNGGADDPRRCPTFCGSVAEARVTHHWKMTSCKTCLGHRPKPEPPTPEARQAKDA